MNPAEDNTEPEEFGENQEEFIKKTEEDFEKIWKDVKEDVKDFSKKELAKRMFVSGVLLHQQFVEEEMQNSIKLMKEHPEEMEKMMQENESFWSEGSFTETMSPEEAKRRERTIHMKNTEEMNYNCKSCNVKISAHNKDLHNGMCDKCFNRMIDR